MSWQTTDAEWQAAAKRKPLLTLARFKRFSRILDGVLRCDPPVDYVVFPELSLPRRWVNLASRKLAARGTSLIAGLEYGEPRGSQPSAALNQALVALATDWPGYRVLLPILQSKLAPAYEEEDELARRSGRGLAPSPPPPFDRPIYQHGDFCFGLLICSDLTAIENRQHYQGAVDALFLPAWNRDLPTFDFLVDSAAHDIHAFIVTANNRQYGDSRINAPYAKSYRRDVVRTKGGDTDYFVVGSIQYLALREFQSDYRPDPKGEFKPFPIGFKITKFREALRT